MTGTNYRLPRSPVLPGDDLSQVPFDVITDMPVRAMLTSHAPDFNVPARQPVTFRGLCLVGHETVARVDISADGGGSWRQAVLDPAGERFAWRGFALSLDLEPGAVELVCRATDGLGNTQPLDHAPWNRAATANNVVHRLHGRAV